jgi:hypothetical protein
MENDKERFEYEGKEWTHAKQDFRAVKYVSVFDGKIAKDLYANGVGDANWPVGVIRKGKDYRDAGLAALRPLLLIYRPFVPTLQPTDIRRMTLKDRQAVIDGCPCVELEQILPKNSSIHLWVDTTRDYILVRRLIIDQGKPSEQIDIRYHTDANIGWVPSGWKIVTHGSKGELFCSISAILADAEFNIGVEPKVFELEFPPAARVQEESANENYILRQDGTKRPILDADIGATYEQMLNSDPGEALQQGKHLRPRWGLTLIIACGLSALVVFIWRRRSLRKSPQDGKG